MNTTILLIDALQSFGVIYVLTHCLGLVNLPVLEKPSCCFHAEFLRFLSESMLLLINALLIVGR